MAVVLYKKGKLAKIRGILCDFQIFETDQYHQLLAAGWYNTPEDMVKAEAEKADEEADLEAEEGAEDAIRAKAKAAGISHYYNKSIDRLIGELKALEVPESLEEPEYG